MEESIWKKGVGKDANMKDLGLCHRIKEGIYAKKGESILTIEREKRESTDICGRPVEEGIYLTLQVTPDIASTLCGKKEWHMENGTRLSTHKPVDDKKWVPFAPYYRYIGWSRKEKGIYKVGFEMGIQ